VARGWINVAAGLLAICAMLVPTAVASAKPKRQPNSRANPYTLPVFELPASNGYSIYVFGIPATKRAPGKVIVEAWNANTFTSYAATGRVSDGGMRGNLGRFGRVSVRFRRSGVKRLASLCGQGPEYFTAGSFEGRVRFEGEEGYTAVLDSQIEVEPLYRGPWECASSYSTAGAGRGVILQVLSRYGETQAVQNDPQSGARFMATAEARSGGVEIRRFAEVTGAPSSFEWDESLKWANAKPPPPFSGTATYRALGGRVTHWEGNLKVDFAGFPGYPLTPGPSYTAFDHGNCSPTAPVATQGTGPPLGLCLEGWSG
jgi:hypothetical protein